MMNDVLQVRILPEHRRMLREVATHLRMKRSDFFRVVIEDAFTYFKEQNSNPPAIDHAAAEKRGKMSAKSLNARIVDLNVMASEYRKIQGKLTTRGRKFYLESLRKQAEELRSEIDAGPRTRAVEFSNDLLRLMAQDTKKIEVR